MDKTKIDDNTITTSVSDPTAPTDNPDVKDTGIMNSQKQETEVLGTKLQESDQLISKSPHIGKNYTKSDNDRAAAYLNDVDWDLAKLEEKYTKITEFTWPLTAPMGTTLVSLVAPQDFLVTPAQKAPFDLTRLWKCSQIKVRIMIKSSAFYQAAIVVGFTPLTFTPNYRQQINMGAAIHSISSNSAVEFNIPFRYPVGYITVPADVLGTFTVTVLSPLATGTGNDNTVTGVVYASIEDSHFKIPDVIPPTKYISHKFDKHEKYIYTVPESGTTRIESITANVNDSPSTMKCTTMCAGQGQIGSVKVPHFQDHLDNLVEFSKRYVHHTPFKANIPAGHRLLFSIPITNLYAVAMNGLQKWFAMFRGSVNVRIELATLEAPVAVDLKGKVFLRLNPSPEEAFLEGIHNFSPNQPAAFTVPWTYNSFVATTGIGNPGKLEFEFYNYNTDALTMTLDFKISLGDDFHMGLFLGAPDIPLERGVIDIQNVESQPIPFIDLTPTIPEAGVLEFIDRALETTLPIVEKASLLGSKLDAFQVTYQPYPIQNRNIQYEIPVDLPNYTERLLTLTHNSANLPDRQCFGSTTNETDIQNLLSSVKSLHSITQWNKTDAQGTKLGEFLHGPYEYSALGGDMLNCMSSLAYKWTGGVIYIFDIIASRIQQGQLLFSYTPNSVDSVAFNDATQTYFTTLELSEGNGTIAIKLPYLSELPYRNVVYNGQPYDNGTHAGKLEMFVQNELRTTTVTADFVSIITYVMAADDFKLDLFGNPEAVAGPASFKRTKPVSRPLPILSSEKGSCKAQKK